MSGSGSSKATSTRPIQTKTDTMFEATKHLLTTASWLESAAKVLEECIKIFVTISQVDLRSLKGHNI
jgi:hypothetical protein